MIKRYLSFYMKVKRLFIVVSKWIFLLNNDLTTERVLKLGPLLWKQ